MNYLRVDRPDEKHIRIRGVNPGLEMCLQELPLILSKREEPRAQKRLFPNPTTADDAANQDWQEHVAPDLRHIFESAHETVVRDLVQMQVGPVRKQQKKGAEQSTKPTGKQNKTLAQKQFTVIFPAEHLRAWMCAVNEARLILGEIHGVTEEDMNTFGVLGNNEMRQAVLRIHLLGWLMELLVEADA